MWLIDKSLQEELIKMNEKNFHLSTLVIWMGHEYVSIPYTRRKRTIGTSKWTMSKKIKTFIDSFKEVISVKANDEINDDIYVLVKEIEDEYKFEDSIARVSKVGRELRIEIDFI